MTFRGKYKYDTNHHKKRDIWKNLMASRGILIENKIHHVVAKILERKA